MWKRLRKLSEQGEEIQAEDLAPPVILRVRNDSPTVLTTYPVIASEKSANTQYQNGYKECTWKHISIKDLKEIKQTVISYGMHSTICYGDGKHMASN